MANPNPGGKTRQPELADQAEAMSPPRVTIGFHRPGRWTFANPGDAVRPCRSRCIGRFMIASDPTAGSAPDGADSKCDDSAISIAGLLGLVALAGVSIAALTHPSPLAGSASYSLTLATLDPRRARRRLSSRGEACILGGFLDVRLGLLPRLDRAGAALASRPGA